MSHGLPGTFFARIVVKDCEVEQERCWSNKCGQSELCCWYSEIQYIFRFAADLCKVGPLVEREQFCKRVRYDPETPAFYFGRLWASALFQSGCWWQSPWLSYPLHSTSRTDGRLPADLPMICLPPIGGPLLFWLFFTAGKRCFYWRLLSILFGRRDKNLLYTWNSSVQRVVLANPFSYS